MSRERRTSLSMTTGAVMLTAAFAIFAADIPAAHAQVAEVVVTARKREENVQNIPIAVTAITGKQVEQFNLTNVEDVAQRTPQLIISRGSSGSGADITMRGIGAPISAWSSTATVNPAASPPVTPPSNKPHDSRHIYPPRSLRSRARRCELFPCSLQPCVSKRYPHRMEAPRIYSGHARCWP